MTHEDLGPRPDPKIEPGEPNPGGVDAIDGGDEPEPTIPDLPTDKNPAVEDAAPDELKEGEDTSTQATDDEEPISGEKESPA
ncbi:MAG: hypothetical protein JWO76_1206 [Nocardioides sp.]|nr:hypothetical protein [Nocardioides sp.]